MGDDQMKAIKTSGLSKRYKDVTAVKNLNLEIEKGELFSLLGVNGAGKSTVIKILSCLAKPTGGDAFVGGFSITKQSEKVKSVIAVSPQETAVAENLSVKENLEFMAGVYQIPDKQEKINELIKIFKLDEVLSQKAKTLSGGWQRKVSIAISLINDPQILFLDEPTLGLDVLARTDLWEIIRALKGKVTVILTTHYMEEAEALSDRVAIMKEGRVLVCDTPQNIKKAAQTDSFEQAFIRIVKEEQA